MAEKAPTAKALLKRWLPDHGYTGLSNEQKRCWCDVSRLSPLECLSHHCRAEFVVSSLFKGDGERACGTRGSAVP
jgi:hypothetical protein